MGAWNVTCTPGTYRVADGSTRARIDINVLPLKAAVANPVAPHGLIGQSLHDSVAIKGKIDQYLPNAAGEFTTSAQGEGAIEGNIHDYEIVGDPFSILGRGRGRLHCASQ